MPKQPHPALPFVQAGDFARAQKILEETPENKDTLSYLSMIHRYHGHYTQERLLVMKAHALYPDDIYITNRLNWYQTPLKTHLTPRPPLCLPADPSKIPNPSTLAQTCFVTLGMSDKLYFDLLLQQIASVRATRYYAQTPYCIIDTGLTEEQKQILMTTFQHISIKDPFLTLNLPEKQNAFTKITFCRTIMNLCFPGYRFYMWLATDSWVQDENSIHDFLHHAALYGAGLVLKDDERIWTSHNWMTKENVIFDTYPKKFDDMLNGRYYYSSGAFCVDVTSNFFAYWQSAVSEILKTSYGLSPGYDELAFVLAAHQCGSPKPLSLDHCFVHHLKGLPVLNKHQPGVLCEPTTLKPIGIIYLDTDLFLAAHPIFPMHVAEKPLDTYGCLINSIIYLQTVNNAQMSNAPPDAFRSRGEFEEVPTQLASYHYRSWPEEDKEQALRLLQSIH